MILNPPVIALLLVSLVNSFFILLAGFFAGAVLRYWDIHSGSEGQLILERRTYLIATILSFVCTFQIVSFFLFIFTADELHRIFAGAMCAAGTLNVNPFGYPALILKLVTSLLAGCWLILNHVDQQAPNYPLIRFKYGLLLGLAPLLLVETIVLGKYFLALRADVITSCCGSLFGLNRPTVASELAGLPAGPGQAAFYTSLFLTGFWGLIFYFKGKGARLFSALSLATCGVLIVALIGFISPYFYELPTHHCPFCLLQAENGYIGYPLYLSLLLGAVSGGSVGILSFFKNVAGLSGTIFQTQRRLTLTCLGAYFFFALIAILQMMRSNLIL